MKRSIKKDLKEFIKSLRSVKPIACENGQWWIESPLKTYFRNVFGNETKRLIALARGFEAELDALEMIPVRFGSSKGPLKEVEDPELYIEASRLIARYLTLNRSPEAKKAKNQLLFKTLSLKYRLEEENGGVDLYPIKTSLVNILKRQVYQWKLHNHVIPDDQKGISERDLLQIQETSQYPEFIQLILQDKEMLENYMLWTYRDKNSAKFFIEYPSLRKKLVECNLNGRIGRLGDTNLKIQKVPSYCHGKLGYEKIVTLPFEGVDTNILDESLEVVFRGNYRLTVGEVFQIFKDKQYKVGRLEYLFHGVTNWNAHNWGYWDAKLRDYHTVNLSHNQWWEQLPLFEIITQDEALQRYGKRLDGVNWCVAATATRGTRTLDFENTHAFLEVAIPWGDGRYAVYDFGKFATQFPSSFSESLSLLCQNLPATVAYPDENVFYSHRQTTHQAFVVSQEQGVIFMDYIKKDMVKSKNKNFVYQIESDNCAKWVHHILEDVVGKDKVPDMFRMNLLDTEPQGPASVIFNVIKKLPSSIQTRVMAYCHLPMGAAKETWVIEQGRFVYKSLTRHNFFRTGEIFLPALLHKKKESGLLEELTLLGSRIRQQLTFSRNKTLVLPFVGVGLLIQHTEDFWGSLRSLTLRRPKTNEIAFRYLWQCQGERLFFPNFWLRMAFLK